MRTIFVLALTTIACGCAPSTPHDPRMAEPANDVARLEADFGGPAGLMEFFDAAADTTISGALEAHDVGFSRQALLTDCNPTFPADERNT